MSHICATINEHWHSFFQSASPSERAILDALPLLLLCVSWERRSTLVPVARRAVWCLWVTPVLFPVDKQSYKRLATQTSRQSFSKRKQLILLHESIFQKLVQKCPRSIRVNSWVLCMEMGHWFLTFRKEFVLQISLFGGGIWFSKVGVMRNRESQQHC